MSRLRHSFLLATLLAATAQAQDYDALIQTALTQRNAGELAAAEKTLWAAYELATDKSEVSYLLGLVLAYQGLYGDALALIDEGLAAFPDDANLRAARTQVRDMQLAAPGPAAGADLPPAPVHQVSMGFGHSTLDVSGFADWNDRQIEYRFIAADGGQHYLRAEHNHRFGLHDSQFEAGTTLGAAGSLPVQVAVGFAPNDAFMPRYFARLAAGVLLAESPQTWGALVLNGQFQHSSWANGNTQRLLAGFEYYLSGVDAWLTPSVGMVRDQDGIDTFAWTLGAHWNLAAATRIGLSYSDAPETENLQTRDSTSWGAYWRQELVAGWRFFLSYSRSDRDNSYVRESVSVTLQLDF
jgi:YaiO family outer membrane protein